MKIGDEVFCWKIQAEEIVERGKIIPTSRLHINCKEKLSVLFDNGELRNCAGCNFLYAY